MISFSKQRAKKILLIKQNERNGKKIIVINALLHLYIQNKMINFNWKPRTVNTLLKMELTVFASITMWSLIEIRFE